MATKTKGDWEEMKDPDTGALFYYNHKTGANQWEKPPEFKQEETEEKKEWGLKRTKSMSARKVGEWEEMKDPDSGAFFYYNHKTGANQWEMPSEFTAQVQVEVDAPSDSAQLGMKRTKSMRLRKFGDWEELKEEESGKIFFYNHKTGVSVWDVPAEFTAAETAANVTGASNTNNKFALSESESDAEQLGMKRTKSMRLRKFGDWEELKEEESGKIFFYNHKSGVSQWDPPAEFQEQGDHVKNVGDWEEMKDSASEHVYYYNKKTGVTQWDKPEGYDAIEKKEDEAWGLKRVSSMRLQRIGDWESFKDENNADQVFYYNHKTGESLWEAPEEFRQAGKKTADSTAAALIAQQHTDTSMVSAGESTDADELHTMIDDSYTALGI